MVPPLVLSAIFLVSFCAWGCARAALVNRTIEDFDPSMQYNCSNVQRCDANSTNSNPCHAGSNSKFEGATFTLTSGPCQIKIPFVGTAVYAFMACVPCQFEVDKTGLHPATSQSDSDSTVAQLIYFNNTLANDTHTLFITTPSEFGMLMDYVVYTFDDSVLTTQGASSTTSTSASATSTSGPVKGGQTQKSPKPRADVRAIVGGVLGGLVIIISAAAIISVKRRTERRKKLGCIYLVDPYSAVHPSSQSAGTSGPEQHDNAALATQIRELQAEFRAALGTQSRRAPSDETRPGEMKNKQMQAGRDREPAAFSGYLVLHTDSRVHLAPATQLEELPPDYVEG